MQRIRSLSVNPVLKTYSSNFYSMLGSNISLTEGIKRDGMEEVEEKEKKWQKANISLCTSLISEG